MILSSNLGLLICSVMILMVAGFCFIIFPNEKWLQILYGSLGALIFSAYLVFDTQLMLGGKHKYSLSPEEYIFAALNLYLDIINIFMMLLLIISGSK